MIHEYLTDLCTYWPPGVPDGYGGYIIGEPQVLTCRIRQKQQLIRAKDGLEKISQSTVLLTKPIDLAGRLYLGADILYWISIYQPIARDFSEFQGVLEPQAIKDIREGDKVVAWRVYV